MWIILNWIHLGLYNTSEGIIRIQEGSVRLSGFQWMFDHMFMQKQTFSKASQYFFRTFFLKHLISLVDKANNRWRCNTAFLMSRFHLPGDSQPMDVCSVHHNNTFLRYSVSLLGYGFYGDLLTDSERKTWMGPARYNFSGRKTQRLKVFLIKVNLRWHI